MYCTELLYLFYLSTLPHDLKAGKIEKEECELFLQFYLGKTGHHFYTINEYQNQISHVLSPMNKYLLPAQVCLLFVFTLVASPLFLNPFDRPTESDA